MNTSDATDVPRGMSMTAPTDTARYEAAGNLLLLVEQLLDTLTPEGVVLWLTANGSLIASGDWAPLHAVAGRLTEPGLPGARPVHAR